MSRKLENLKTMLHLGGQPENEISKFSKKKQIMCMSMGNQTDTPIKKSLHIHGLDTSIYPVCHRDMGHECLFLLKQKYMK